MSKPYDIQSNKSTWWLFRKSKIVAKVFSGQLCICAFWIPERWKLQEKAYLVIAILSPNLESGIKRRDLAAQLFSCQLTAVWPPVTLQLVLSNPSDRFDPVTDFVFSSSKFKVVSNQWCWSESNFLTASTPNSDLLFWGSPKTFHNNCTPKPLTTRWTKNRASSSNCQRGQLRGCVNFACVGDGMPSVGAVGPLCPVIRPWDTLGHHETSTGDTKDCHLSHLSAYVFPTKNYNIGDNNSNNTNTKWNFKLRRCFICYFKCFPPGRDKHPQHTEDKANNQLNVLKNLAGSHLWSEKMIPSLVFSAPERPAGPWVVSTSGIT